MWGREQKRLSSASAEVASRQIPPSITPPFPPTRNRRGTSNSSLTSVARVGSTCWGKTLKRQTNTNLDDNLRQESVFLFRDESTVVVNITVMYSSVVGIVCSCISQGRIAVLWLSYSAFLRELRHFHGPARHEEVGEQECAIWKPKPYYRSI